MLTASASDVDSSVSGVKFYINGTLQGSEDTSAPYTINWDSTATTTGAYSVFAVARDAATKYATSTTVSFTVSNTGPTPTSVISVPTTTTSNITWTTSPLASTRIFFGPSTAYGSSTPETNTSTRVTSHSVGLTGLPACALYYYEVVSRNAVLDTATSSVATFTTTGCTGGASVLATGVGSITTASGGTLTQGVLTLTVPTSFTSTSSSATFQAKLLDATAFFASAGAPSSKTRAGDTVFNLKALTDATTTLATFSTALTVTLAYTTSDISGLDESTLLLYRYDGSSWSALSGCSTNTSAKTVACTTTSFSDFAIFGSASVPSSSTSSTTGGGGTIIGLIGTTATYKGIGYIAPRLQTVYPDGRIVYLDVPTTLPVSKIITATSSVVSRGLFRFNMDLRTNMRGVDVRELQRYLNNTECLITGSSEGSIDKETTYFGSLTRDAVICLQKKNNITPSVGYFGSKTRAFVNTIQ